MVWMSGGRIFKADNEGYLRAWKELNSRLERHATDIIRRSAERPHDHTYPCEIQGHNQHEM